MSVRPKGFKPPRGECKRKFDGRKAITSLYDTKWERYRFKYLAINPNCYACGATATVIDHIQAHRGDETLFWKLDNLLPLCARCHNSITALFDKPGKPLNDKLTWIKWSRARNEISSRVKVVPIE